MSFSVIKVLLAFITVTVLLAGTFQGSIAYSNYCDDHNDVDYFIGDNYKKCDFKGKDKYAPDVDFVAVIFFAGVGALFWVSSSCS